MSIGYLRMVMKRDDRLNFLVKTDSYVVSLVKCYRASFVLNALFALADRRVTVRFLFANIFVNFLQYVEDEWPLLVGCIEKGIIPDVEDLGHLRTFRGHIFKHLIPKPRAAELREIGPPGIQGWAVLATQKSRHTWGLGSPLPVARSLYSYHTSGPRWSGACPWSVRGPGGVPRS
ncbi:uncharacterized protein EDB91DRAFT_1352061 [Suillus paluster]|uniref:uncharacterized protein n=1 Tax=Suillus paluster TaxID=48578 RepID=UPI001B87EAD7|nr:uncharacterized protein EDB91DRAFT_1352531 [Suillus paluster]XP_041168612.1 uncharacterized protein EDB91DRAFT_1352061 [Suillus paluster]KAG1718163.1 hypothetical protein EDB91DRAFT_1352531 [Suillus paluster]KAG1719135.1 hypothetical protein EDB91DRAFT_1352061 [Suillus paluster]